MKKLYKNIKQLIQVREPGVAYVGGKDMKYLPVLENAWLLIDDEVISDFGLMENLPEANAYAYEVVDCTGRLVLPAWCDSHTHIVYAGNREGEFADKINGYTYEEIAKRGGGILNSAKLLQETSEEDLFEISCRRLDEVIAMGTGAIEIKSGYGLTAEAELKMLRVIKKMKENYPVEIKSTFLGAHALPVEYKSDKATYVKMLIEEALPAIAKEGLADFIDVFCEEGYFSVEDTDVLMKAGKKYGIKSKIHVNQFNAIGGVLTGVKNGALSVDHLEVLTDEDIQALNGSSTMPVGLPGCSLFLSIPYTPARKIMDAGLPFALASDFNPGSSPSGNMNLVVALGCIKMKMTPEEAINAATLNGAYAMGVENRVGSVTKGKIANLIITKTMESYAGIPYSFGTNPVDRIVLKGKEQNFTRF